MSPSDNDGQRKRRYALARTTRAAAFVEAGYCCAFPGCQFSVAIETTRSILEIAHIHSYAPGGPRYEVKYASANSLDNLIVLCPTHHHLVDAEPHRYSAQILQDYKAIQAGAIASGKLSPPVTRRANEDVASERRTFQAALALWEEKQAEPSEEYWHQFFCSNARIIALAVPNHIILIGDKYYVGGKAFDNKGGNVVDFVYASKTTSNVTLVEIKSPISPLMGSRYRSV